MMTTRRKFLSRIAGAIGLATVVKSLPTASETYYTNWMHISPAMYESTVTGLTQEMFDRANAWILANHHRYPIEKQF